MSMSVLALCHRDVWTGGNIGMKLKATFAMKLKIFKSASGNFRMN